MDRDALKMSRAGLFSHACFDGRPGPPHGRFVGQVKLHAPDVSFMRDRFGVQLQDNGIADLTCESHRFIRCFRRQSPDGGNTVERKQLFGFRFRK